MICFRTAKTFSVSKMKWVIVIVALVCLACAVYGKVGYPLHASCKIKWFWAENCSFVNENIVSQIKNWSSEAGCKQGGEKCLYTLKSSSPEMVEATHETPKRHYVDDLKFAFTSHGGSCSVQGSSSSETWYAVLDFGTNYCNLHNLITGSGLDKAKNYTETTSNSVCTEYSSANCDKY